MDGNQKCFTFIWKIKNFSFCVNRTEILFKHPMNGTNWRVVLLPSNFQFKDSVACYIQSCLDYDRDAFELDLELSFIGGDESVLKSETLRKKVWHKGSFQKVIELFVKRSDVYLLNCDLFIPDDTFIIRFRMSDRQELTSVFNKIFAETRIGTECRSLIGTIKDFSCIELRKIYSLCNKSSPAEISDFSANLTVSVDGLINLEIKFFTFKTCHRCEISIVDIFGNRVKVGHGEFNNTETHFIPLAVSKDYLIKYKECFLPGDVLTIHCEINFPGGETIKNMKYIFDSQETRKATSNTRFTDISPHEPHIENLKVLKNDLISLFNEGILSDTKLKTATETFSAHMAILSARSPVFKSMFTTDMKERTNHCVDIDDLDADTMRRMLLFMYSASLHDLEYESAKSLYFAADKYNIVSLRQKCSSFLKQNLLFTNCCSILLLADKHQDKDLKDAAQEFIAKSDEAVLSSDEWRNLEKNNCQLVIEVYRFLYRKNRRN